MKQDLLIEGVITPWWFQAKPSDPMRCSGCTELRLAFSSSSSHATEEGFGEVGPASQGPVFGNKGSLVFTRRCRCGGTENTPDCLELGKLRVWGWLSWIGSGPQGTTEPAGMGSGPGVLSALSMLTQTQHARPTPKIGIDEKADLGYISWGTHTAKDQVPPPFIQRDAIALMEMAISLSLDWGTR